MPFIGLLGLIGMLIAWWFIWRILRVKFSAKKIIIGTIVVLISLPFLGPILPVLAIVFCVIFWYFCYRGVRNFQGSEDEAKLKNVAADLKKQGKEVKNSIEDAFKKLEDTTGD